MQQHQQISGYHVVIGLAVALASTYMACGFSTRALSTPEGIQQILNAAPYTFLTDSNRWTVYEVSGKLRVEHGYGCAQAPRAASETYVGFRIQDIAVVPLDYGDAGTVFLNGWHLRYANDDHHVQGLGSAIYNIIPVTTGNQFELHWDAGGVLSDENGDDAYEWCYWYTLVFWKRSLGAFDAVALQQESVSKTFVQPEGEDAGNDTAVRDLPGAYTDPGFGPRAVLPRGFALTWPGTDHHVLQAGFDLGTPVISGNEIAWTSQTLLKDNDTRRAYQGAELVSILSGQSVQLWQPNTVLVWQGTPGWVQESTNFTLTPYEPISWCTGIGGTYQERQYWVQDVPFDYAVPVLTGWELGYLCTDHHVRHAGVWITGFDYVKDPNAATGTLLYTVASILEDDSDNASYAQNKVSILGFNMLDGSLPPVPQPVSQPPPDDPPAPPDDPPAPPDDPPERPPVCLKKPWTPGCEDF